MKGRNLRSRSIPNAENKNAKPKNRPHPKYSIEVTTDGIFPICQKSGITTPFCISRIIVKLITCAMLVSNINAAAKMIAAIRYIRFFSSFENGSENIKRM